MRYVILSLLLLLASPSWACDNAFIQEPTFREPDGVQHDLVAGMVWLTYYFLDGRTLVVAYQLLDVQLGPVEHPLFYIVIAKDHTSLTYIDREGHGNCTDIQRY